MRTSIYRCADAYVLVPGSLNYPDRAEAVWGEGELLGEVESDDLPDMAGISARLHGMPFISVPLTTGEALLELLERSDRPTTE